MDEQLELLGRDAAFHNVYFAALPGAVTRASIDGIARGIRQVLGLTATLIPPERLHVSLVSVGGFSGSCPPAVIDAAKRAACAVSMAPFRVEFDRVAHFSAGYRKRALVLTGDDDGVVGFMRLQRALSQALMKAGLRLPRQSGSLPHLTMLYGENRTFDFPIEPIGWTIDRFVLVDSLVGQSRHVHLGQWLL